VLKTTPKTSTSKKQNQQAKERRQSLPQSIQRRNQAVLDHLGLAHLAASRQAARGAGEQDDLIQEARLGLIKAMEKYDPRRGFKVSSYAMALANGQILHFRRDRSQTVRIPWRLKDLYVRGIKLQESRINRGLTELTKEQLAKQLKVTVERWQQAIEAQWKTQIIALDRTQRQTGNDQFENNCSLLDQIKSPKDVECDQQCLWLREVVQRLPDNQQRWLSAHYIDGISLRELAKIEAIEEGLLRQKVRSAIAQIQQWANAQSMELSD